MANYGSNYAYGLSYYKDVGEPLAPEEGPDVENGISCFFSLALNETQGVVGSFSENTGDDCVWCEPGFTGLSVEDDNGLIRHLLLDDNDGKVYDVALKNGPTNSGIVKYWKDKVDADGENGTDIEPYCSFGADSGTFEHYLIKHAISHIFARAADKSYRGATGYDSNGFFTGIEFLLRLFVDSEQVTPERKTKNIPITGDIHVDDEVEGHAIQLELSANMGCHMIIGRKTDYIVSDTPIGDLVMTEDDYQEELCQPAMWYSPAPLYIDRADGLELSSTIQDLITATTGVTDGSEEAWSFTEALALPSITLSNGTLMLWHQGLDKIEIGSTEITLTDYDEVVGDWTLSYATGITASGAVTITPTGTGKVFDLRAFNSEISSDAIEYYFDNINDHDGDVVLP